MQHKFIRTNLQTRTCRLPGWQDIPRQSAGTNVGRAGGGDPQGACVHCSLGTAGCGAARCSAVSDEWAKGAAQNPYLLSSGGISPCGVRAAERSTFACSRAARMRSAAAGRAAAGPWPSDKRTAWHAAFVTVVQGDHVNAFVFCVTPTKGGRVILVSWPRGERVTRKSRGLKAVAVARLFINQSSRLPRRIASASATTPAWSV